ncbi:hypothetical protein B296_00021467 [Ensete ventricosum]|uniref:Uncharacterized protein n=1 Tax=Ensete ventricosum TaxID=4639 RepID=A0A426ZFU3_ENSVE|nr:hypothetical protein B296_00021467 [Ensete ventricosum]
MAAHAEAEAASSEHGREGAEDDLLARDGEAHVVVEAELLLGLPQQALELGVGEVRDGHDEPAPALAHVHREVALGHVHWLLLPPQARAPLQYLLDARGLRQLVVRPPNRHLLATTKSVVHYIGEKWGEREEQEHVGGGRTRRTDHARVGLCASTLTREAGPLTSPCCPCQGQTGRPPPATLSLPSP